MSRNLATGHGTWRRAWIASVAVAVIITACNGGAETTTTPPGATPTSAAPTTEAPEQSTTTQAVAHGTITVGALNPLTGIIAQGGIDANDGFALYVDNAGGSLAGWEIEIVSEDTESTLEVATTKIRKLVDVDEVDFMFGLGSTPVAYGLRDYIDSSGIPFIITQAGADGLTQTVPSPYISRVTYTGSQNTMPLGDYTCTELGYQTATLLAFDFGFGWEAAGGFARTFEDAGCDVIQEIYTPIATQDYAPFLQQVSPDAEVLMFVLSPAASVTLWRAIDDFGLDIPVVGHGAINDEQFLEQAAGTSEGAVSGMHYSQAVDNPQNAEFVESFRAATGREPGFNAEAGYLAAQVLEAALEITGADGDNPEVLAEAIRQVELDAPGGPFRFDEFGQGVFNVYILQTEGGANTIVETFEDTTQFWTYDPEEYLAMDPYESLKGTWGS